MPDDIISILGQDQVDILNAAEIGAKGLLDTIKLLNTEGRNLEKSLGALGGSASLANLNQLTKQARENIEALKKSVVEHEKAQQAALKTAQQQEELDRRVIKTIQEEEKAYQQASKTIREVDKTKQQAIKTAIEEEKQAQQAIKTKQEQEKSAQQSIKTKREQTRYEKELQKAIDDKQKALDKEAAKLKESETAYGSLKAQYRDTANQAKELGAQVIALETAIADGKAYPGATANLAKLRGEFNAAQQNAAKFHNQLLTLEKSVGQSQRNVGNYTNSVFALTQVLREAPSFAYSAATGLLAISNNLPMLADEFNKVRLATGSTQEALKIFAGSLFTFTNLLTIGITIVTIFAAQMAMAKSSTDKHTSSLTAHNKEQEEFNRRVKEGADAIAALNAELNKGDDENVIGPIKRQIELLKARGAASKEVFDAEQKLRQAELYQLQQNLAKFQDAQLGPQLYGEQIRALQSKIADKQNEIEAATLSFQKDQLDKARKAREKANEEMSRLDDARLAAKQKFNESQAAIFKARYEKENQLLRGVYENESNTLEDRLAAYYQFQENRRKITENENANDLKSVQEHLAHIAQIEKRGPRNMGEKEELLYKKYYKSEEIRLTEDTANKIAGIERESQDGINKIYEQMVAYRLSLIKSIEANTAAQEDEAQKALVEKYRAGEVSWEEYNKRKEAIAREFAKNAQLLIIDYIQEEIDALKAQGIDVSKLQEKLNEARKKLYEADLEEFKKTETNKVAAKRQAEQEIQNLIAEGIRLVETLENQHFQAQLDRQERLMSKLEDDNRTKIALINAQYANEQERNDALARNELQYSIQRKQIQNEEIAIKRKQAQANKAAAIAEAIEGGAVAVINALKIPIYGEALAIAIAAITAAQIAVIASAPLPQYAKGGIHAKSGLAIVGEEGRELVETPSGNKFLTPPTATTMFLEGGSKIHTHETTMKLLQGATLSNLAAMGKPVNEWAYAQAMIEAEERGANKIVDAIRGIKQGSAGYVPVPDYKWSAYLKNKIN